MTIKIYGGVIINAGILNLSTRVPEEYLDNRK
jgi:hypothetical protein